MTKHLLIGNSFPLSLIRRRVVIAPTTRQHLLQELASADIKSFWGHENTLYAVNRWLGVDLTPTSNRPALTLSSDNFPHLDGETFHRCFVLSPDYRPGYRPAIGAEVDAHDILGWQTLEIIFCEATTP